MSTPYLSEIKIMSFGFAPKGWAQCNGQLMPINQNQALFSLLGTTYGGDGRVNFALPNLQGRVPFHMGTGFLLGQLGGEQNHTLVVNELPAHTHSVAASSAAPTSGSLSGNVWCSNAANPFNSTGGSGMNPASITNSGGGQPHLNMSPYLALNFCIALQGIFPSQN
jgi:microcystin-dependent protein